MGFEELHHVVFFAVGVIIGVLGTMLRRRKSARQIAK